MSNNKKIDFSKYPSLNLHKPRLQPEEEKVFIQRMKIEHIHNIEWIDGRGYCGLMSFMFTVGLVYGIGEIDYDGRYCYPNATDAMVGFLNWKVLGGENEPANCWIKHKSKFCDIQNPNLIKT